MEMFFKKVPSVSQKVHTLWWLKSTAVIHILGFRCFFFFAYKYLYTCLAGTPAQPYSHKG